MTLEQAQQKIQALRLRKLYEGFSDLDIIRAKAGFWNECIFGSQLFMMSMAGMFFRDVPWLAYTGLSTGLLLMIWSIFQANKWNALRLIFEEHAPQFIHQLPPS
jgi:hypothetical protein